MKYIILFLLLFGTTSVHAKPKHAKKKAGKPVAAKQQAASIKSFPSNVVKVILTFDDGPRPGKTEKVLAELQKRGIHAVFFLNGGLVRNAGVATLRKTYAAGHVIGNHTMTHVELCRKGDVLFSGASKEITRSAEAIEKVIGFSPPLFRTPFGQHCKPLGPFLRQLSIEPVGWDIDSLDWKFKNSEKTLALVKSELLESRRDPTTTPQVILFHDSQPTTIHTLPMLLDWMDQENRECAQSAKCAQFVLADPLELLLQQPRISRELTWKAIVMTLWARLGSWLNGS